MINLSAVTVVTRIEFESIPGKAREDKLTYNLLDHLIKSDTATAGKSHIEFITKVFKVYQSAKDTDHSFIVNS